MIDMTQNRVPYGLLTDEEKAALHEHEKAGGWLEFYMAVDMGWHLADHVFEDNLIYRTVPLPKTQDVIAWERLPDWVEWVARDENGMVWAYDEEPSRMTIGWGNQGGSFRRIDDYPGIVEIGTVGWRESKQRRPRDE